MDKALLKARTKKFALPVIKFTGKIPRNRVGMVIEDQILRGKTSVGSNYRSLCNAKSTRDFINKLSIVLEEADETMYWLELLLESGGMDQAEIKGIYEDARQIAAKTAAALKTSGINNGKSPNY